MESVKGPRNNLVNKLWTVSYCSVKESEGTKDKQQDQYKPDRSFHDHYQHISAENKKLVANKPEKEIKKVAKF